MPSKIQPQRFIDFEKIFLRISLGLLLLSLLLLGSAFLAVYVVFPVPDPIISFTAGFLYFHAVQFLFLFGRILKYLFFIRPKYHAGSFGRSFLGMVLSPIGAAAAYLALFLMALTSCAA